MDNDRREPTILLTGPVQRTDDWVDAAENAGWHAVVYPLIQVKDAGVDLVASIDGLPNWIVVTSRNALAALERAANEIPELRSVRFACVGEVTLQEARAAGFKPALPPAATASELAQSLRAEIDPESYVLWPRGSLSSALGEQLRKAGHVVADPVVYETLEIAQTAPPPASDVVFFASPSGVKAWVQLATAAASALAIGPTTRAELEEHPESFVDLDTLASQDPDALTAWLREWIDQHNHPAPKP